MSKITPENRYKTIARVNWVCTLIDTILTIAKLGVGFITRSPGLIADGLHSFSDLATDILALILGNLAQHGPDEDHPYGHARYETIGTVVLGTVLIVVAFAIGIENIIALVDGTRHSPSWFALATVAVSVVAKEGLFHFTMKYAKLTRSNLLEANAWHSRSDSLSSIVVFVGILFNFAGYAFVEYIAALAVAALIGKMGVQLAWNAMQDLIDRGVPEDQRQSYVETIKAIDGIVDVHMLRSRLMGADVFIDAHIQVAPTISISEGHQINDCATRQLREKHTEISDVTLHIDFEADHDNKKTKLKPKRNELVELLTDAEIHNYSQIYLHYQNNLVQVELLFDDEPAPATFAEKTQSLIDKTDWLDKITAYQLLK